MYTCILCVCVFLALWATRQTEETKTNRELYVKTTLRELIIYIVFLIVICVSKYTLFMHSVHLIQHY